MSSASFVPRNVRLMAASHPTGHLGGALGRPELVQDWQLPLLWGLGLRPPSAGPGQAKPSRAQEKPSALTRGQGPHSPPISASPPCKTGLPASPGL